MFYWLNVKIYDTLDIRDTDIGGAIGLKPFYFLSKGSLLFRFKSISEPSYKLCWTDKPLRKIISEFEHWKFSRLICRVWKPITSWKCDIAQKFETIFNVCVMSSSCSRLAPEGAGGLQPPPHLGKKSSMWPFFTKRKLLWINPSQWMWVILSMPMDSMY